MLNHFLDQEGLVTADELLHRAPEAIRTLPVYEGVLGLVAQVRQGFQGSVNGLSVSSSRMLGQVGVACAACQASDHSAAVCAVSVWHVLLGCCCRRCSWGLILLSLHAIVMQAMPYLHSGKWVHEIREVRMKGLLHGCCMSCIMMYLAAASCRASCVEYNAPARFVILPAASGLKLRWHMCSG